MEIWQYIKGYEGKYKISSCGNIKSIERKTGHKYFAIRKGIDMALSKDQDGYLLLRLSNGKSKMFKVHRLVAENFIPNPNNYKFINHIDNNPANNNVKNLEWCTPKQNSEHRDRQGRQGRHPHQRKIGQYDIYNNLIKEWDGLRYAKRQTGINNIDAALHGRQNTSGGFKWKFL